MRNAGDLQKSRRGLRSFPWLSLLFEGRNSPRFFAPKFHDCLVGPELPADVEPAFWNRVPFRTARFELRETGNWSKPRRQGGLRCQLMPLLSFQRWFAPTAEYFSFPKDWPSYSGRNAPPVCNQRLCLRLRTFALRKIGEMDFSCYKEHLLLKCSRIR